jgi:mannosyltransferase
VLTFALYALGPIGLVVAFDLYKPAWLKFLLIVLPAWHVLVARGIVRLAGWARHRARSLSRVVTIAACLALAGLSAPSLANLYFNPAYARDDYRGIAAHIAASAAPDACVVLDAPNQWEVFTYYYPDRDVYPAPYRPSPAEARQFVERVLERCERLYVLYWGQAESDPQALIETALAECTYTADARWYGNVRLVLYGVGATPAAPQRPSGAAFGASIRLQGVAVEEMVARGGILPVTLFWQALAPIGERYKVTVQLLDAQGQLVAQHDGEPGAGLAPTTAWAVGEQVVDRHGIPLPGELGAGEYTLLVGLYHALSGERLPVSVEGQAVGDHLRIGTISCCR